ncbi:hypothetical protein D3C86_1233920 [compost metagenome]
MSAMRRLPDASAATPLGFLRLAPVAAPLSPAKFSAPLPATVVIVPLELTMRMRWFLLSAM